MNRIIQTALAVVFSIVFAGFPQSLAGPEPQTESAALWSRIDQLCRGVEAKVVVWRRDFHEHPELGNTEVRTAGIVAAHLRSLGLEVRTGVAVTGVIGLLRGGKPGPVVALRADMDALPVKELTGLLFASKARQMMGGREVDVMHACGHDAHTAILMGAAEVLASIRDRLPGTVKFIFQPAEDGRAAGDEGGAGSMIREGALENPRPDAVFGLHVFPIAFGSLAVRPGGIMAASDGFTITVKGRQTHGAMPWDGVDSVVAAAQIILGLQTIVSRQTDLTKAPAVVTVGIVRAGVQGNIIPQETVLSGTIRTLDPRTRKDVHERVRRTAEKIAASAGAEAEVEIGDGNPVVVNDPALTRRMTPVLARCAGAGGFVETPPLMTAEDFALYAEQVPGMFFFLGIGPADGDPSKTFPNHSPYFQIDEGALPFGVKALVHLAVERLLEKNR